MSEEIGTRLVRLDGHGVTTWEADEGTGTSRLWVHPTGGEPSYICEGCGISRRETHSQRERRVRDLPSGAREVRLVVDVHRIHQSRLNPNPPMPARAR